MSVMTPRERARIALCDDPDEIDEDWLTGVITEHVSALLADDEAIIEAGIRAAGGDEDHDTAIELGILAALAALRRKALVLDANAPATMTESQQKEFHARANSPTLAEMATPPSAEAVQLVLDIRGMGEVADVLDARRIDAFAARRVAEHVRDLLANDAESLEEIVRSIELRRVAVPRLVAEEFIAAIRRKAGI